MSASVFVRLAFRHRTLPRHNRFTTTTAASARRTTPWSNPPAVPPDASDDEGDSYEEEEEYYYEEGDDAPRSGSRPQIPSLTRHLPRALRHGEFVRQVRLPEALEDVLATHTVPRLITSLKAAKQARLAGSTEERSLTVDDFAAHRLDRTYAACFRVLHEINCRVPDFAPRSILDFGAYLGSASWATHAIWPPEELPERGAAARLYVAVEPNPRLRGAGAELSETAAPHGPPIQWRSEMPASAELGPLSGSADVGDAKAFDLVVVPYSLSSLPAAGVTRALASLWARTAVGGILAVIDSAGDSSVATVGRARAYFEDEAPGARLLAPFPHRGLGMTSVFGADGSGGMMEPWPMKAYRKSFSKGATLQLTQRVLESTAAREHGKRTGVRNGNERKVRLESFVYLLIRKEPTAEHAPAGAAAVFAGGGRGAAAASYGAGALPAARVAEYSPRDDAMWGASPFGRVLGTPRNRTRHILMDVLTPSGQMQTFTVTKRNLGRADYRYLRKAQEGNTVPMALFDASPEVRRTKLDARRGVRSASYRS